MAARYRGEGLALSRAQPDHHLMNMSSSRRTIAVQARLCIHGLHAVPTRSESAGATRVTGVSQLAHDPERGERGPSAGRIGRGWAALGSSCLALFIARVALAGSLVHAAEPPALPDWTELQAVVRSNLTGRSAAELDRLLVQGLLDQLRGEVVLVGQDDDAAAKGPALSRADLHEDAFAYLRVARVEAGLETQIADALGRLGATNKLQGAVLDLRFATGSDYAASAAVADQFIGRELPLLDWGGKLVRSTEQTNDFTAPVAVLINARTAGAPEALAAVLRESKVALLLGATTAGHANVFREFTLQGGQRLRIASAKVRLGDGEVIPADGVRPDVEVAVKAAEEQSYLEDPWRVIPRESAPSQVAAAGTNASPRRLTEADLIRQRREELGERDAEGVRPRSTLPAKPVLQDPVLARAMDLLKGLAIVRQGKTR